ncbi:PVC-type heme-binding CxxCH protein [Flavihumibacter profundi]|uniref:PVC-type heme-binding CxxCH protein n=1 Tax=Flavihumibacter profundi TaxID=2716883 RepID=UPI001CC3F319|nr:PVC-type heme-binding CxxCH protein [Flavihumibacter profundi]MBZ5856906.1 ThuA domain-containing protein [Flavihumibacter profundi]
MHKRSSWLLLFTIGLCTLFPACKNSRDDLPRRLEILFLGHTSEHHNSEQLAGILSKEYFKDGINISYTTTPDDLNEENLNKYDGLILYANYDSITPSQEKALLQYVKSGRGFIPLHCASYCFRNSPEVVELIGGQFLSHQVDSFYAVITDTVHPVMKNVQAFKTTDETYVHDKLSKAIKVLTERVDSSHHEPYTWVRDYGDGRVFYTAYGHDEKTFNNPGFQQLVKNGILWAVGDKALKRLKSLKIPSPVYTDAVIPNYEQRNPAPKLQASLSPAESMLLTQVPVDFELQLFASEPDIINPIYMNWDERGRLWVIETVDYPNTVLEDKQKGDDRIKILEDTNGDGKADKFTIFADKLNIPTSFTFSGNGIIVAQAPYFISLQDTNGDDKADKRDTIMTGWGIFDTHAGPSNFRYGFDNQIWGTVGYSGFKGKVGNDSMHFSQGLYHFRQDGKQLEYLSTTSNNTWGLGFSEEFDVFISTANNTHSGFYGLPKKLLDVVPGKETGIDKIDNHYAIHVVTKNLRQVDVFGGFTAAAGHGLYTARNFPKEYWNHIAFVCEPTGRLIHKQILEQNGAGFKEKGDGWNILASADEWMGPIQAEVGPDGALWVADWYDFIIQHNPTPPGFETGKGNAHINPLRDHDRGRIYRVVYKNAKPSAIKSLDKKDLKGLTKALTDDNMFWRTHAQRLLVEAGNKDVLPDLYKIVQNESLDETGINAPAIHALWTIHGLNALNGDNQEALDVALKALHHPAAGVRKAAIQVLPKNAAYLAQLNKANVFKDKDLRVRLAALVALSGLPASAEKAGILAEMAKQPDNINDRWIQEALQILSPAATIQPAITEAAAPTAKYDQFIQLKVVKEAMKYDRQTFTVKAGSTIKIELQNPDFMQHNLLVLQPGSLEKVGAAADNLAKDPIGVSKQYIPDLPEVLAGTPLINPGGSYAFILKVPDTPGEYPYICSFPGHWRIMKGIMQVTKK